MDIANTCIWLMRNLQVSSVNCPESSAFRCGQEEAPCVPGYFGQNFAISRSINHEPFMVDRPWDCKVLHCALLSVTVLIFLYEKYSGFRFLGRCISLLCSSPRLVLIVKTHKNLSFKIPGNPSHFFFAIIIIVSINITMSIMLN